MTTAVAPPMSLGMSPSPMEPRLCRAHSSQTGAPCRAYAVKGAVVCRAHGASSPAVKEKARERLERQKLGAFLAAQGIDEANGDPLTILLEQLSITAGVTDRVRELVAELEEIVTANHKGDDKPHVLLKLWAEWSDRTARLAKVGLDNGLAEKALERLSRIGETQAAEMVEAFTAAINDPELNLTPEQKAIAKKAAARHLRATTE